MSCWATCRDILQRDRVMCGQCVGYNSSDRYCTSRSIVCEALSINLQVCSDETPRRSRCGSCTFGLGSMYSIITAIYGLLHNLVAAYGAELFEIV